MTTAANRQEKPRFAVRIKAGLVAHFDDEPIVTHAQATDARNRIFELTGEYGEIEAVLLYA